MTHALNYCEIFYFQYKDYEVQTAKITDVIFMKGKIYTLTIQTSTDYDGYQDLLWFGLYQIALCSKYGKGNQKYNSLLIN